MSIKSLIMGIDWIKGEITGEQFVAPPELVRPTVATMVHGDVAYIPFSFFWVDKENNMWVDLEASRFEPGEIDEKMEDFNEPPVRCVRICVDGIDGFFIDASALDMARDGDEDNRLVEKMGPGYDEEVERAPVIGWVGTDMELEVAEGMLKNQFGIVLGECAVKEFLRTWLQGRQDEDS